MRRKKESHGLYAQTSRRTGMDAPTQWCEVVRWGPGCLRGCDCQACTSTFLTVVALDSLVFQHMLAGSQPVSLLLSPPSSKCRRRRQPQLLRRWPVVVRIALGTDHFYWFDIDKIINANVVRAICCTPLGLPLLYPDLSVIFFLQSRKCHCDTDLKKLLLGQLLALFCDRKLHERHLEIHRMLNLSAGN